MMLLKKLYEPGNIVVISQVNLIPGIPQGNAKSV